MSKLISVTIRNRAAATLVIVALLALGAVFLTMGIALLLGLAVVGTVVGAGFGVVRALRGGRSGLRGGTYASLVHDANARIHGRDPGLDPTLEIAPTPASIVRPVDGLDDRS